MVETVVLIFVYGALAISVLLFGFLGLYFLSNIVCWVLDRTFFKEFKYILRAIGTVLGVFLVFTAVSLIIGSVVYMVVQ